MSLSTYYQSIGQSLPSIADRAKIYESSGLGSADSYVGSAAQNNSLESILKGSGSSQTSNTPTANQNQPSSTPTPSSSGGYDLNAIVDAMMSKGYNNRAEAEAVAKGDPERFAREYLGLSSSGGSSSSSSNQTINLEEKYNTLLAESGVSDLQTQADEKQAEIDALNADAAEQRARIGENPFLSEAALNGRIAKIDKKLNEKLAVLDSELSTINNKITTAKNEVANKLNLTVQQYNIDKAAKQENLTNFNNLLASGALINATSQDIATLAEQTGLAASFIQTAIEQSKVGEPQIITQTDSAGNVTIVSIDTKTGNILNTVSAGKIGKGTSSSSGDSATIKTNFNNDVSTVQGQSIDGVWVGQFPQLVMKYAPYMSLQEIYKLYAASDLGQKYGTPTEDPADIQALYDSARGN